MQDVLGTKAVLTTSQQYLAQGQVQLAADSLQSLFDALAERLVEPAPLPALVIA